jgi:hypothetical protein
MATMSPAWRMSSTSMPKAIAHVLIPSGVGIGQEFASLRKFDSGILS